METRKTMSKFLATFSGRFGDILWSMATVKRLAEITSSQIDFACMPQYKSLLPLIQAQPYIDKAFVYDDWKLMHSNFGDQPWNPPKHLVCIQSTPGNIPGPFNCQVGYKKCWHLGFRTHPGLEITHKKMALIDFIAWQQGITFNQSPIPFLQVNSTFTGAPYIAIGFNEQYKHLKDTFVENLTDELKKISLCVIDVTKFPWFNAAGSIYHALGFIGCRSSNYVIAHGIGQRNIMVFDPHPAHHPDTSLGRVFGNPYKRDQYAPLLLPVDQHVHLAAALVKGWKGQMICA